MIAVVYGAKRVLLQVCVISTQRRKDPALVNGYTQYLFVNENKKLLKKAKTKAKSKAHQNPSTSNPGTI